MSTLCAPQLFIRIKSVQLLCAALQAYSTPIASTCSLPRAIKRRLACCIGSTWKDFCVVFLMKTPITCMCCNKLKVRFLTRPWISELTNQQLSMSSSTNGKQGCHTIHPSCSLIKSSSPNETVAEHPCSANQKPTFFPTPRITFGAQQLRRRQRGRSLVIIALSSLEVRLRHILLCLLLLTCPKSSRETRPHPNERTPSNTRRPTHQHDQRATETNSQHAGTRGASERVGSVSPLIVSPVEM